jgi:hypothetical protein
MPPRKEMRTGKTMALTPASRVFPVLLIINVQFIE